MSKRKYNITLVGIGRWGKNLLREFKEIEKETELCRINNVVNTGTLKNRKFVSDNYLDIKFSDFDTAASDPETESMVIATPIQTHFDLARKALKNGKHVFLEKPPTNNTKNTKILIDLASSQKRVLFIDNIFFYHPLINHLQELLKGETVKFVYFDWIKEGPFSTNMIEDLAYHDIYILIKLFGPIKKIRLKEYTGIITLGDIIRFEVFFMNGLSAKININRAFPIKNKAITIVTKKNSFVWTDEVLYQFDIKSQSLKPVKHLEKSPLNVVCFEFLNQVSKSRTNSESNSITIDTMKFVENLVKQSQSFITKATI